MTSALRHGDREPVEKTSMVHEISSAWRTSIVAWLAFLELRGLAQATLKVRGEHLRFIAARVRAVSPAELTTDDLLAVMSGRRWSASYRKMIRESLRSFCVWALSTGVVTTDVSTCLPPVKPPTPRPRPATDAVWSAVLGCGDSRVVLMARLAGEAGLRRAEVAGLHTDDLIVDADGGWSLIVRGKGNKQRVVPINDDLASVLQQCASGWVFVSRKGGGSLTPQEVGQMVSRAMGPGWSMHKLRHRYATRGYAGTGNLRAVQEALGHASVATTQRYTAVSSRDVRAVTNAAAMSLTLPEERTI